MRGWCIGRRAAALLWAALTCGCTPTTSDADLTAEVRAMLARSAEHWNAGNLEGFLSDYADDSTTSFMARGGPQYGFDWIRRNYAPRFEAGVDRDSLQFTDIAARPLAPGWALATARFTLTRGDSTTSTGPFTLVLHRTDERWKIVHDHTTSD